MFGTSYRAQTSAVLVVALDAVISVADVQPLIGIVKGAPILLTDCG